ncbi:twin-arginine translocase TatA/TatE family subunit [Erythrobacter sp.]|jgi:sec-independent protein translocase protein TatA|uniref:twin-arginine translocase TatA/TatE family subunit n=1 Tax=Erythrobacter sp. TaxID=1042 RepID=UPI002EA8DD02|nr:twin-arginine translocase TatA/TatE family subunit [Erythrobacter sp.]
MNIGVWQILILAIVILVLFGRGRISEMMGDFGRGISSFKKGMTEDEASATSSASKPNAQIEPPATETSRASVSSGAPAQKAPSESGDTKR